MFFESLDARRLMAVTGLDPTFGRGGIVKVTNRPTPTTLSAGGAVFVETVDNEFLPAIRKYTSAGRLDTSWGNRGVVAADFDVTQMAYDRRTGKLYAAGPGSSLSDAVTGELTVMRLNADGSFDSTFGTIGGKANYNAEPVAGRSVRMSARELVPLSGGRLLVALDRSVSDDRGVTATNRVTGDISVMRLRNTGVRDVSFGKRGITTLLGTAAIGSASAGYRGEHTTFHDLAVDADGTYKAVLTRESGRSGASLAARDYNPGDTTATVSVKLRSISTAGVIDADKAYSWTVADGSASAAPDGFTTPLIRYGGSDRVVSVAQTYTAGPTVGYSRPLGYTFVPGRRPIVVALPVINSGLATRNDDGYLFVGTSTSISRLRPDFTLDRTFASNGTATSNPSDALSVLTPDSDGGVLARVNYNRLVRFA